MTISQLKRQLVSTRLVLFFVLLVFIRTLVVEPMQTAVEEVRVKVQEDSSGDSSQNYDSEDIPDDRISFFQPFVSLGNSGMVSLLLPLFFLVMISGLPSSEKVDMFVHIRTDRLRWIVSQILTVFFLALGFTLLIVLASGLLTGSCMSFDLKYCESVTRYNYFFPDKRGEYVLELIPPNLYNQFSFGSALIQSAVLLFSEFFLLGLILIFFAVLNMKFIGVLAESLGIAIGTILTAAFAKAKWIFTLPHTILWLHKYPILKKEPFPMAYSYLYFGGLILLFIILDVVFVKKYESARVQ